jgi:hypothetical protein
MNRAGNEARPQTERIHFMHYLMLITFEMLPGELSQQARKRALGLLQEDQSFCGEGGGRFGSPICDWFVIGGRWSGHLRATLLGQPYRDTLEQRFPKLVLDWYSDSDVAPHRHALNALWREYGGTGPSPYNRSSYEMTGYDDDALPVDQQLYDRFLVRYRRKSDCDDGSCRFADLDGEDVGDSFIGRKWIAVVDYHN